MSIKQYDIHRMNVFSFIKQHVTIFDVVREYTSLKRAGMYWKGSCPFHSEKTASFTVSPHKEIFYCFGCHAGGDVIAFMSKIEQCSQFEAVKILAERYALTLPDELLNSSKEAIEETQEHKKRYQLLCKLVASWCHEKLLASTEALAYCKQRSIDVESIKNFQIGFFPPLFKHQKELLAHIQQQNFLLQDLIDASIIMQGQGSLYSPFENRIIFPITDHLGRNCGFGGRIYQQRDERPKYYNSKEHEFFLKGSLLFGLDKAKKAIQTDGHVFLVEGYTDCIAMVQHGYPNTVATLGTACTAEHLQQLSRYGSELIVLYDGDQAGNNAMLRLTELCWQVNLELKVIKLPDQEDPASYLAAHGNLGDISQTAQDIFVFSLEQSGKKFLSENLQMKLQLVRSFTATIAKLTDPLKVDLLLQRAAHTFDIPYQTLKTELATGHGLKKYRPHEPQKEDLHDLDEISTTQKEISVLEKKLFSVIINNRTLLQKEDALYLIQYLDGQLGNLLQKIVDQVEQTGTFDFTSYFDGLTEQEKLFLSRLLIEFQEFDDVQSYEQLLMLFQKSHWKSFVHDTKLQLSAAGQEHDSARVQKILDDFQMLKKRLQSRGII